MSRPAVTPRADKGGRVEDRIRNARDSLPGMRDALPKCALGGVPTDPLGDKNANAGRRANVTASVRLAGYPAPHARLSNQAAVRAGGSVG
jgi:hypothetical protein